jgi:thiamine-monophosphate kinase
MREFELIESIRRANAGLGTSVTVPPGDDLGMISLAGGVSILSGVDQVVAGVHLPLDASPEDHGRKVINRSLSDVAAMAAIPVGFILSATLPGDLMVSEGWAERFADAARDAASTHQAPIFGGDVATFGGSEGVFVASATVLAVPDPKMGGRVVLRSGARAGDLVCVSGCFGGSLKSDGRGHHLEFQPRIDFALALHRSIGPRLTSMIDVSDGLAADAAHLGRESGVGVLLRADDVPRRGDATAIRALTDGEDYELCFTVSPDGPVPESLSGVPITRIGIIEEGDGMKITDGGVTLVLERDGWEHSG